MKLTEQNKIALEKVRGTFSEFRRLNPTLKISDCSNELKEVAMRAVEGGCSMRSIGEAVGVNYHMIARWRKKFTARKAAKELVLVKDEKKAELTPAVIRLRSGVCIEIPIVALTTEFLGVLSLGVLK